MGVASLKEISTEMIVFVTRIKDKLFRSYSGKVYIYIYIVVSMLASGTQGHGFKPGRSR
jgi:hypothetical protein